MPSIPSYYFTLFKKFQVLNHVPAQTPLTHGDHISPQSGFDLTDPNAPFNASLTGTALTVGDFTPANNPLWLILNARAMGIASYTQVSVPGGAQAGQLWPAMPPGNPPAWLDFQINAAAPKLVDVFASWITTTGGQVKDIPTDVFATMPPSFAGSASGIAPFVCSMPGDQGVRPGVPSNFWATSLIFLVDPQTGHTITPSVLAANSEYYLVAVIGNRGNTNGGHYLNNAPGIEAAASVMVWNTTDSPGVELPALSNLDINDTNGIYSQYFLRSGQYDVIGFRLNVNTVYDGIVAALQDAVNNHGLVLGMTPDQWVHAQGAHLCSKVVVRNQGDSFPAFGTVTPDQDARLAQKNLAPFDISLVAPNPNNPNIVWKNFIVGQPLFLKLPGAGHNKLFLETNLPGDAFRFFVAMPRTTFKRIFVNREKNIRGFRMASQEDLREGKLGFAGPPMADAVVLEHHSKDNILEIPARDEKDHLAMSLGIQYDARKLKPGVLGEINLVHRSVLPKLKPDTRCFDLEETVAGGFTFLVRAEDPHLGRDGKRIEFPDE